MISVQAMNGAAAFWFTHMTPALWESALVALVVSCIAWLGRRWPAPLRHGLWLVALLKFAVPPLVTSPFGLLPVLPSQFHAQEVPIGPSPARFGASTTRTVGTSTPKQGSALAVTTAPARPGWRTWVLGAYVLGVSVVAASILRQGMRLRRWRRRSTAVTAGSLYDAMVDLHRKLGLRRRSTLLLSDDVPGPVAFGVLDPAIIVPRRFVRELSPAQLRVVLSHELAHHRRGDPLLNVVHVGLSVVWWFDPVFWWVSRQLRSASEDCCDDLVLGRGLCSGMTYCETLLRSARVAIGRPPTGALACHFGGHPLRRRLSRVLRAGFRPATGISPVHAAVLVAAGLAFLPGGTPRGREPRAGTISSTTHDANRRGDLEPLRRQLASPDAVHRARAATQLGERRALDAIPQLAALLADETPIPRAPEWNGPNDWTPARRVWLQPSPGEAAAISLASMSHDAAPALIAALADARPAARRNAAWALGELHHPRLPNFPEVPPLVVALRDRDAQVRAAAAWALGETKDRRATEALSTALHDADAGVRTHAAHALGELADARAADALLEALDDADADVRRASAWALDEIVDRIGDTARRRGD